MDSWYCGTRSATDTRIDRPGPDAQNSHSVTIGQDSTGNELQMVFFGAVLHLRGKKNVPQPLVDDRKDVLCWNGEIFGGIEVSPQ